jgi:uncharacterized membrane protein YhaH (DUF805 family)
VTNAVSSALPPERGSGIAHLLFGFDGGTGWRGYWIGLFIAFAAAVLVLVLGGEVMNTTGGNGIVLLDGPLLGLFIWIHAAATIKRLRDAGLSAWVYPGLIAAPLIVAVAAIEFAEKQWMLILLVIVGVLATPGLLLSKTR